MCGYEERSVETAACGDTVAPEGAAISVARSQAWIAGVVLLCMVKTSNREDKMDEK